MWFIIVYKVSVQRIIIYSFMSSVMLVRAGVSWVTLRFWFLSVNLSCRWTWIPYGPVLFAPPVNQNG